MTIKCEHDMDDIPIGEYEDLCEVVGYQNA